MLEHIHVRRPPAGVLFLRDMVTATATAPIRVPTAGPPPITRYRFASSESPPFQPPSGEPPVGPLLAETATLEMPLVECRAASGSQTQTGSMLRGLCTGTRSITFSHRPQEMNRLCGTRIQPSSCSVLQFSILPCSTSHHPPGVDHPHGCVASWC